MSKRERELFQVLRQRFPDAFRFRPLKLKIHLDLLAALDGAMSEGDVIKAIKFYTSRSGYLRCCSSAGVPRIDLAGNESGIVDEMQAQYSNQQLAKMLKRPARIIERRENKQKQQQQRPKKSKPPQSKRPSPFPKSPRELWQDGKGRDGFAALREAARNRKMPVQR